MSRDLTAGMVTDITAPVVSMALAAEFDFAGGMVRVWTGAGTLTWNTYSWTGIGDLGGISPIREPDSTEAAGVTFSLSGIPSSLISLALGDNYRGRACRCWLLTVDHSGPTVQESSQRFAGRMDTMTIDEGAETSTISISAESHLVDLTRPRATRYTDAEQQRLFPGDLGLEYVAALVEKPLYWGFVPTSKGTNPGIDNTPVSEHE